MAAAEARAQPSRETRETECGGDARGFIGGRGRQIPPKLGLERIWWASMCPARLRAEEEEGKRCPMDPTHQRKRHGTRLSAGGKRGERGSAPAARCGLVCCCGAKAGGWAAPWAEARGREGGGGKCWAELLLLHWLSSFLFFVF